MVGPGLGFLFSDLAKVPAAPSVAQPKADRVLFAEAFETVAREGDNYE